MSQLIQAFLRANDVEGNTARINIAHITRIEGRCKPQAYATKSGNKTTVHSINKRWCTGETPEEIYASLLQAQQNQLRQLKDTRLLTKDMFMDFNAYARIHDKDGCVNFIAVDTVIRVDNEHEHRLITTSSHGAIPCIDSMDTITAAIEDAEHAHIKMLQKNTIGIS